MNGEKKKERRNEWLEKRRKNGNFFKMNSGKFFKMNGTIIYIPDYLLT